MSKKSGGKKRRSRLYRRVDGTADGSLRERKCRTCPRRFVARAGEFYCPDCARQWGRPGGRPSKRKGRKK